MTDEQLIEDAAKALTALTDAEWEIATAEGTEHLTGYFDAARRVLAVFEEAHAPTNDEREALANLIPLDLVHDRGRAGFPVDAFDAADRILAVGFRRSVVPEVSAEPTRLLRECTICGEKLTMSNATEQWEKRHEHSEQGEPSDALVGAAMNAAITYYEAQGHTMRPESVDFQAMRAALRAVTAL